MFISWRWAFRFLLQTTGLVSYVNLIIIIFIGLEPHFWIDLLSILYQCPISWFCILPLASLMPFPLFALLSPFSLLSGNVLVAWMLTSILWGFMLGSLVIFTLLVLLATTYGIKVTYQHLTASMRYRG